MVEQSSWDARYKEIDNEPRAAQVLSENLHLLPTSGKALDLACGLGGNALLLAKHGLEVEAWDLSAVAIEKLLTHSNGLPIQPRVIDINPSAFSTSQFDVITVSYFLDRSLAPTLIDALKPNGLLFYQTFNRQQLDQGPRNLDYRLQDNELLQLFDSLSIRYYREDATAGSIMQGIRNEAMLVAQKCA